MGGTGSTGGRQIRPIIQDLLGLIPVFRGLFAIMLGIVLLFAPEKSQGMLVNTMGFFWLFSGLAVLRTGSRSIGKRTALIVGVVGVLTGLLVITRDFTLQQLPLAFVIRLLGTVIMLTGALHMFGEVRIGGAAKRGHVMAQFLLGAFEFALGVALIWSPTEQGLLTYWVVTLWSLVFGVVVIGDAIDQRIERRKKREASQDVKAEG